MKNVSIISMAVTFTLLLAAPSQAAMDSRVEAALQDVCHSSLSNNKVKFKRTMRAHGLNPKVVAEKVVCNGEDIGTFAADHGADKTANFIRSLQKGRVVIQELASL